MKISTIFQKCVRGSFGRFWGVRVQIMAISIRLLILIINI